MDLVRLVHWLSSIYMIRMVYIAWISKGVSLSLTRRPRLLRSFSKPLCLSSYCTKLVHFSLSREFLGATSLSILHVWAEKSPIWVWNWRTSAFLSGLTICWITSLNSEEFSSMPDGPVRLSYMPFSSNGGDFDALNTSLGFDLSRSSRNTILTTSTVQWVQSYFVCPVQTHLSFILFSKAFPLHNEKRCWESLCLVNSNLEGNLSKMRKYKFLEDTL